MSACIRCGGALWVCENDHARPWGGISDAPDACTCEACAGDNCPMCNPSEGRHDPPRIGPGVDIIDSHNTDKEQ